MLSIASMSRPLRPSFHDKFKLVNLVRGSCVIPGALHILRRIVTSVAAKRISGESLVDRWRSTLAASEILLGAILWTFQKVWTFEMSTHFKIMWQVPPNESSIYIS